MMKEEIMGLLMVILVSLILIVLSIVYFIIMLFVIKVAADVVFDNTVSEDSAVLAAALITLGTLVGGSISRKPSTLIMNK
jgi:Mn2+/Fe2+ NRAMP family transporter